MKRTQRERQTNLARTGKVTRAIHIQPWQEQEKTRTITNYNQQFTSNKNNRNSIVKECTAVGVTTKAIQPFIRIPTNSCLFSPEGGGAEGADWGQSNCTERSNPATNSEIRHTGGQPGISPQPPHRHSGEGGECLCESVCKSLGMSACVCVSVSI